MVLTPPLRLPTYVTLKDLVLIAERSSPVQVEHQLQIAEL